ncbi:hypothetical protein HOY82DRAFT_649252 [Tuber indicum]|nr:hypothetical protein HOY82DRAFT_649252 [Tuber indicum]
MPSRRVLRKDEVQGPDPTAYHMQHSMNINWPCLSIDMMQDGLGHASIAKDNEVPVMKWSGLQVMQQYDVEEGPILQSRLLQCSTTTNRIRAPPHVHNAVSMAESGNVYNWDLSSRYKYFESPGSAIPACANQCSQPSRARQIEGHTVNWSFNPRDAVRHIATGDNTGKIFISRRKVGGTWATDGSPLKGHTGVKIYDALDVSSSDVKIISSCSAASHLLATGTDDGPITSIELYPNEDSIVSVQPVDSTIMHWDLSAKLEDGESKDTGGAGDIPPQLFLAHYRKGVAGVHLEKVVIGTVGEGFGYSVLPRISMLGAIAYWLTVYLSSAGVF